MKEIKFIAIFIACIILIVYLFDKSTVWYTKPAKVIQHIFTQSKNGDRIEKYFVIVQYENGEVEERVVNVRQYVHLKDGQIYYFTKDSNNVSLIFKTHTND
jgi:hypothetical protein